MNQTTSATLPEGTRAQYELTEALSGGPVFALPHYGQGSVDFSTMTPELADALIAAGFPYLRRRAPQPAATRKASAKAPITGDVPEEDASKEGNGEDGND